VTEQERKEILKKARIFFREKIAVNHKRNTAKLQNLSEFKVNPFLDTYLANFAFGTSTPENIARAMIYPRILGTSITTSFGTNMQNFCNVVLSSYASIVSGIDVEFIDAIDGRRKYCQTKAGPQTINKDDVTSVKGHFRDIRNLARTNQNLEINPCIDCIVGVLYGTFDDVSAFYKQINEDYPVVCGKDFWHRLTGDINFYNELISAFAEVAIEMDSSELIEDTIIALAAQIRARDDI
jgi:hypothetical protein